ncbi:MAG: nickel insertion protein, partial [Lachnospiraceae bacterium]
MEEKMLYLECYSGISGDMVVGALLDLGADEDILRHTLDQLQLPGYEINISRTKKNGIDACSFDVSLPGNPCYDEGHGMTAETCISGAGHEHSHGHEHGHEHGGEHSHGHEHGG